MEVGEQESNKKRKRERDAVKEGCLALHDGFFHTSEKVSQKCVLSFPQITYICDFGFLPFPQKTQLIRKNKNDNKNIFSTIKFNSRS